MDAHRPSNSEQPVPGRFQVSALDRAAAYLGLLGLCGGLGGALAAWLLTGRLALAGLLLGGGVGLAAVVFLYLANRWRVQPVRRYRQDLERDARNIAQEIRNLQGGLNQMIVHRQVMDSERRSQIESLKPAYRERSADLNALFLSIDERERAEVASALQAYQEAFVRSAISDASIRRVRVPGFTPRILGRLEEAGILTAVDITTERLKAIPSLDPFLIQELDLWRQRVERDAEAHKPRQLPPARLDPIRMHYQEERLAVMASMEGLVVGMQGEVFKIEDRIDERVVQSTAFEENLGKRVTSLAKKHLELREEIGSLGQLTFWRFLLACLAGDR